MRKHFYFITSSPDEDYIGRVMIRDTRAAISEKNVETSNRKMNTETGESYVEKIVSMGYADFDDEEATRRA